MQRPKPKIGTVVYLYEPFSENKKLRESIVKSGSLVGRPFEVLLEPPEHCEKGAIAIGETRVTIFPAIYKERIAQEFDVHVMIEFTVTDGYEELVTNIIRNHIFVWGKSRAKCG